MQFVYTDQFHQVLDKMPCAHSFSFEEMIKEIWLLLEHLVSSFLVLSQNP